MKLWRGTSRNTRSQLAQRNPPVRGNVTILTVTADCAGTGALGRRQIANPAWVGCSLSDDRVP